MNNRSNLSAVSALLLIAAIALSTGNAAAQDANSLAGTYTLVSSAQFGDNPRGQLMLGPDGHYSIIIARATLPKVAAGSRVNGTAVENKAIIDGSIAHFGKYTVDANNKTITFNVEVSTFPNYDGRTFKRAFKISGNQLIYTNNAPSSGGAPNDVVWARVK